MRLPRVTLQHGPAGGHVQSCCINGVHSGVLRRLRETRPGKKINPAAATVLEIAKSQGGWKKYKTDLVQQQSATPVCQCKHMNK